MWLQSSRRQEAEAAQRHKYGFYGERSLQHRKDPTEHLKRADPNEPHDGSGQQHADQVQRHHEQHHPNDDSGLVQVIARDLREDEYGDHAPGRDNERDREWGHRRVGAERRRDGARLVDVTDDVARGGKEQQTAGDTQAIDGYPPRRCRLVHAEGYEKRDCRRDEGGLDRQRAGGLRIEIFRQEEETRDGLDRPSVIMKIVKVNIGLITSRLPRARVSCPARQFAIFGTSVKREGEARQGGHVQIVTREWALPTILILIASFQVWACRLLPM